MKPEEFNHILSPMRSGLKLYAQRFTGDADDAEDLVQEALLRLWNMRSGLDLSRDVGRSPEPSSITSVSTRRDTTDCVAAGEMGWRLPWTTFRQRRRTA